MNMSNSLTAIKDGSGRMSRMRRCEIPLLYGKPSDRSITDAKNWTTHLRKVGRLKISRLPRYCVLSFPYIDVGTYLLDSYGARELKASGEKTPWYFFEHQGMSVVFAQTGMGAPRAGATLEELFALRVRYVILVGGVGVLDSELARWTILVPTQAIRDEGTSYHYQTPSIYSFPSPKLLRSIRQVLERDGKRFVEGVVWTTDAVYRETLEKRDEFARKGAICVDMEASALFSIARYRRRHVAALFYAGDYVGEDRWDLRVEKDHEEKKRETAEKLLNVSLDALHSIWLKEGNPST